MSSVNLSSAGSVSKQQGSKRRRGDETAKEEKSHKTSKVWLKTAPQLAGLASSIHQPYTSTPQDQGSRLSIEALIQTGNRVDDRHSKGNSALKIASKKGEFNTVWELIKEGASVTKKDLKKVPQSLLRSWILECCEKGLPDPLNRLLETGVAYPDTMHGLGIDDLGAQTSLDIAAQNEHVEVLRVLLKHGVNIDPDEDDSTIVEDAIAGGDVDMLTLFLEFRSQVAIQNVSKLLLHAAIGGQEEMLQVLLDAGAKVNYKYKGNTALIIATRKNNPGAVEFLLKREANPDLVDKEGRTALFHAIDAEDLESIKHLRAFGANMHIIDNSGKTPYRMSFSHKNPAIFNALTGKTIEQIIEEEAELIAGM